jgi:hypothetical protein
MSETAPPPPLQLGQHVRRETDPGSARDGLVVGLVFIPVEEALVRWSNADETFEPVEGLVTSVETTPWSG